MIVRAGALVAVMLLFLPSVAAQADGFYSVEGVEYYAAASTAGSGNLSLGLDYERTQAMAFQGCTEVVLRDDLDHGRIRVAGKLDGAMFKVDATRFETDRADLDGGIAHDIMVDGSHTHGSIQFPAVRAAAAAWGKTSLEVQDAAFKDPVTGEALLDFSYFVTSTGFRDDETGRVRNADGSPYEPGDRAVRQAGDWEMHLRVSSPGGSPQPDASYEIQEPANVGFTRGYLPPEDEYAKVFWIPNMRFGGNGTVQVNATALAAAGANELTFSLHAPNGTMIGEFTGQPAFGQPFSDSLAFPLDRLGMYSLRVHGQVSLSEYTLQINQETPEQFDLSLWWEDLALGYDARAAWKECEQRTSGHNEALSGLVVGRPPPPSFPWESVVLTGLGIVVAVLGFVKMLMMGHAAAAHRRAVKD